MSVAIGPHGVLIELTMDQFHRLLIHLGEAAGAAAGRGEDITPYLRLANTINEGNPNWTPYAIPAQSGMA